MKEVTHLTNELHSRMGEILEEQIERRGMSFDDYISRAVLAQLSDDYLAQLAEEADHTNGNEIVDFDEWEEEEMKRIGETFGI